MCAIEAEIYLSTCAREKEISLLTCARETEIFISKCARETQGLGSVSCRLLGLLVLDDAALKDKVS